MVELGKLAAIPQIYRHLARWKEILAVLTKFGLADLLARMDATFAGDWLEAADGEAIARHTPEQRIRLALTELGPTGIKLAQILSTRQDLVGVALAAELERLQEDAPSRPAPEVRRTIEQELGLPVDELFAHFEDAPLASASIAQVHAARLPTGEEVAVKVQHAGVAERIRVDLDILSGLAGRAQKHEELAVYRPKLVAAELRRTVLRELDFGAEERHLLEFRRRFRDDRSVRIPRVYPDYSTGRVLTLERLRGIPVRERHRLEAAGTDLEEVARRGADLYLEMIFRHGVYHADPHPGNIVILPGNVIGLLDFGMVGRLDEALREQIEELLLAVAEGDDVQLTRIITRVGDCPPGLDEGALATDVASFVARYGGMPVGEFDLGGALNEMTEMIRGYHIGLPPRVALLIKTLAVLEGTGRLLSPTFSLVEAIRPHRQRLIARRLSPRRQLRRLRRLYDQLEHLADVLPRGIADIVLQLRDGAFDIHLVHRGLEPSVNRLVMGLMASSLFVGSALLLAFNVPPVWRGFSLPGGAAALASLWLGVRLLRAIRHSGRLEGHD